MADLDAVNLGLDENEADIAEELQDFEDSFDTRSEASESSEKSPAKRRERDRDPSISSVSSKSSHESKGSRDRSSEKKKTNGSNRRSMSSSSSSSGSSSSSDSENDDKTKDNGNSKKRVRNGSSKKSRSRSPAKKSSPRKQTSSKQSSGSTAKNYDYTTKLNYLFRDTRFFLIKSNNSDNVEISKTKKLWATLPQNEANLNQAFKESRNVLLIFSVNESGRFNGFARMAAESNKDLEQPNWVLPPTISAKALGGVIELDWVCQKELPFSITQHLYNSWNDGKPVKIGRDGQEIEIKAAAELCRLFQEDSRIELTPILRKSKERAKFMREKGIRVVYRGPLRPPMMSSRGRGNFGPFRGGKRPFLTSSSAKLRHGAMHPAHFHMKRGGMMPYPPRERMAGWERYPSATAAAEAYVAEYMRNMHGQLPPLPFAPVVPQIPAALPPPLPRYYDGPELPPPPPIIRTPTTARSQDQEYGRKSSHYGNGSSSSSSIRKNSVYRKRGGSGSDFGSRNRDSSSSRGINREYRRNDRSSFRDRNSRSYRDRR